MINAAHQQALVFQAMAALREGRALPPGTLAAIHQEADAACGNRAPAGDLSLLVLRLEWATRRRDMAALQRWRGALDAVWSEFLDRPIAAELADPHARFGSPALGIA